MTLVLALAWYLWRRHRETTWTTNGSVYCQLCRKSVAQLEGNFTDDDSKNDANFYVNATADDSTESSFSCGNSGCDIRTLKPNRNFNFMKTHSEQDGSFDDGLFLAESLRPSFKTGQLNRPFDSTLSV